MKPGVAPVNQHGDELMVHVLIIFYEFEKNLKIQNINYYKIELITENGIVNNKFYNFIFCKFNFVRFHHHVHLENLSTRLMM